MRTALIIVDVQPAFLRPRHRVVENICKHLKLNSYDIYIECVFHAEKGSLWDTQTNWICPKNKETQTDQRILDLLPEKKTVHIVKQTKSAFKGDVDLAAVLRKNKISQVHIVGVDTNDCVLATAYESFDYGFETYVIEECCDSSSSRELHEKGIALLRHVSLIR